MGQQRLLVLGAGWLGGAFARDAAAAGHEVVAVRRSPPEADPSPVTWRRGDVTRPGSFPLPSDLEPPDAVVLTVAPGDGEYSVYAAAARAVVALSRRWSRASVIYTSSTGVYAEAGGGTVDESAPTGLDDRARALVLAEEVLRHEAGPPVAILRLSGLYGPGRSPVGRALDPARLPGGGATVTNRVRLEDAVGAMRFALERRLAGVFNVTDDEPAPAIEVARWIAARRSGAGAVPALALTDGPPREPSGRRVSNAALRALGWAPRFPSYREGLADLL